MIKIIGSLIITVSGGLIGKNLCNNIKNKIEFLEDFKRFIFFSKNEIEFKKSSPKNIPKINGITFKFFSTEKSKRCNSLINYFEFFGNYEELFKDLQNFGKSAMAWIEKDSIPGDIFISTIIYATIFIVT